MPAVTIAAKQTTNDGKKLNDDDGLADERSNARDAAPARLFFQPLRGSHIEALLPLLRNLEVYRYIDGATPTELEFRQWLTNAMAGPPSARANETWLNFVVGEAATGSLVGRLEATVHKGLAEVAFLFAPAYWGKGFASEALGWLHRRIAGEFQINVFWACTAPENDRCVRLLERAGYARVDETEAPQLSSHWTGALIYRNTRTD